VAKGISTGMGFRRLQLRLVVLLLVVVLLWARS
jgi:hypothetical protein